MDAVSYADAVTAEAEWFGLDLTADGIPPLVSADGGPFTLLAPYLRRQDQRPRQCLLTHTTSRDRRIAKDLLHVDHEVAALVLWPNPGAALRSHEDQAALDEAVDAVVKRIRGPVGDSTHGGRWWRVGEPIVEPPDALSLLLFVDIVGTTGMGWEVSVRYTVIEEVAT